MNNNKLEAFLGCGCVIGTLAFAIYKGIKKSKETNAYYKKQIEEMEAQSEKELQEMEENHQKEMQKIEDDYQTWKEEHDKKHAETMKKLEEQRQEHERKWNELDARCKERLDKSKDDFDEFIKAGHECVQDIQEVSKEIFSDYPTEIKEENQPNRYETRIVFKGKLAEMMKET